MPTNSFCNRSTFSKSIKLTILALLLPLVFYAQSLTGLWIGSMGNDSTTVRKDQSFEIALTEYKGKVYGYSRSEFIVDDVLYYIVKRVKGTIEGDVCEVTDDEIIAFNFPKKLDKNIKVTSTFRKDKGDSVWHMDGKWKTNATKKYYSVTGKVELEAEKDLTASKIFPHLEELKLAEDVAFYKERKEGQPIVRIAKPEKAEPELVNKAEKILTDKEAVTTNALVKTAAKDPANLPISNKPQTAATNPQDITSVKTAAEKTNTPVTSTTQNSNEPTTETIVKNNPAVEKKEVVKQGIAANKNQPTTITSEKQTETVSSKADNNPVTNTTASNTKAEATNIGTAINNNTTIEKAAATKQDVAIVKNQPSTASANQTETVITNPENKPVTNTTTANSNPEATNNGDVVKNNPTLDKNVKQDATAVKNQPSTTSVKQNEMVNTKTENKPVTNTTASNTKPEGTNNTVAQIKNNPTVEKKDVVTQDVAVVKNQPTTTPVKQNETVNIKPDNKPVANITTSNTKADNKTVTNTTVSTAKPEATNASTVAKNNPTAEQKEKVIIPIAPEKRPDADITLKAAMIAGRKSEFSQVVNFKSDSLQISLYDNGEIDGDTVSVFMNGEIILAKQGLKSSAIKKTIYVAAGQNDEFTLVMFAESLGKYPPNTGLLVIRDGDDIYNLRFSSDFQKNAGIVFKRKR